MDQILAHSKNLNNFKMFKIKQSMFYDCISINNRYLENANILGNLTACMRKYVEVNEK